MLKGGSGLDAGKIIQAFAGSDYLAPGTTTNDIPDSTDKRYVTDAEKTKLANTSGTNTGDETASSISSKLASGTSGILKSNGSSVGNAVAGTDYVVPSGNITGNAGTVTTINGRISAGTNVTLGGTGTSADPYVINASGGVSSGGFWVNVP